MQQISSWEAESRSASEKIPNRLWNIRVHKNPPLILSWARWIQFTPSHPISLKFVLILSSHIRLNLPSTVFPSDLPIKILNASLISLTYATCLPSHDPRFNHLHTICWRACEKFRNKLVPYSKEFLAPRPTPKLEDNPLQTACYLCSFYSELPFISGDHLLHPRHTVVTQGIYNMDMVGT